MLAHELAHIGGNDALWCWLTDVVTALLWWNPLAWFARRELHAATEAAADETSGAVENGPELLAACLVELASRLRTGKHLAWLSVGGFRSGLGQRVERLMRLQAAEWRPASRARLAFAKAAAMLLLLAAALSCVAWIQLPRSDENFHAALRTSLLGTTLSAVREAVQNFVTVDHLPNPLALPAAKARNTPRKPVLMAAAQAATAPSGTFFKGRTVVLGKLQTIILPAIRYDGQPLKDVLSDLTEQIRKHDAEGRSLKMFASPYVHPPGDQSAVSLEMIDLSIEPVTLNLENARLGDVLNAITNAVEYPIGFRLEGSTMVFSPAVAKLPGRSFTIDPAKFWNRLDLRLRTLKKNPPADRWRTLLDYLAASGVELLQPSEAAPQKVTFLPGRSLCIIESAQRNEILIQATQEQLKRIKALIDEVNIGSAAPTKVTLEIGYVE